MGGDDLAKNIGRYILKGGEDADMDVDVDVDTDMDMDIDIDSFGITKFDYRKIFDNNQNLSYREILDKMFENYKCIGLRYGSHSRDHSNEWKELFSLLCNAVYRI